MKRYCLTLDLKDDPQLIAEYEEHHREIWPEIRESIIDSGITNMEIYRLDNRLMMVMEANNNFTFERKAAMDVSNPKVLEWEALMWKFQQPIKNSKAGEKWVLMDQIFKLNN